MISKENFEAHKQLVLEDYEREVQGKSGGLSYWYYVQSAKGMIESFEQLQAENAALRARAGKLKTMCLFLAKIHHIPNIEQALRELESGAVEWTISELAPLFAGKVEAGGEGGE